MAVTTPKLGLKKPIVGADDDVWGGMWNGNADILDKAVTADGGVVILPGLPTSSKGLPVGSVWINGGFLCIVQ